MEGQATQKATLPIEGMGCGGCAAGIERMFTQAPGVQSASVSFSRGEAVVVYDPARTRRAALVTLLVEAGYRVPEASPSGTTG